MTDLVEVKIPHSGSVEEVEISSWLVEVGEQVNEGDFLAEVSTEKADTELEAPQQGKVAHLLYAAGTEVPVGTTVLLLAEYGASDEDVAAAVAAHPLTNQ